MRWKLGFGDQTRRALEPPPPSAVLTADRPAQATAEPAQILPHLDEMGQRGELLRVRVGQLAGRLDELKSLSADFGEIVEPFAVISAELPKAQVRNAELEGLLARERDFTGDLRRQVTELTARANGYAAELSSARGDLQRFEALLRERDAETHDLRGHLLEKSQTVDDLSRQLSAELERNRALQAETKGLRVEVQSLDQAVTRLGRDFAEASERLALSEQEGRRLQLLGEEQAARIADLTARSDVLAEEGNAARERLHVAEARAAAEQSAREKAEAQAQGELGSARAEITNLNLRLETASSRASGLDRLLGQVRAQLREREEAVRASERAFKDAEAERLSHERRVEALQAELMRAGERWTEAQQARADAAARCDMLSKALAAKDAVLEQALGRAALLSDQADQLSRRGDVERVELEATIRRLTEELHNERSERALARGALDIARESRAALQKQYEALKRSGRVLDPTESAANRGSQAPGETEEPNNVRNFTPPDRT
jgi:crescentin